jgi:hypothetical protein
LEKLSSLAFSSSQHTSPNSSSFRAPEGAVLAGALATITQQIITSNDQAFLISLTFPEREVNRRLKHVGLHLKRDSIAAARRVNVSMQHRPAL